MSRLLICLARFFRRLSPSALSRLGAVLGFFFWTFMPGRRKEAIKSVVKHLRLPEAEAARVVRQSFTENARSFLDIFHTGMFGEHSPELTVVTPELFAAYKAEPGPVVASTAHLGSWEKLAGVLGDTKPGRPKMVVVRSRKNEALNRLIFALRGARGVDIVGHRNASGPVMECMKQNGVAAFLVDHNCSRREAIFLPFLGELAAVNMGPAILAVRSKAVVYPAFLLREKGGRYALHLGQPLRTAELTGTISGKIEAVARFYTEAAAEMIQKYPEQWLWMHRRWKTQPKKGRRYRAPDAGPGSPDTSPAGKDSHTNP